MSGTSPPRNRRGTDAKPSTGRSSKRKGQKGERSLSQAVGGVFRSSRELQRLSQHQVAALTEGQPGQISRTAISDIERGRCLPGLEALVSLSRVLHIDPTEVLERVALSMTVPLDLTDLSVDDLKRRAADLFWESDYRGALSVYDAIIDRLALAPLTDEEQHQQLHATTEVNRAVALRRSNAMKAARASAERAIELAQSFPEVQARGYMVLASVLSHEGLLVLAEMAAREGVKLAEDTDVDVRELASSQVGNVLYRAGKFEEARQAFLEARKLAIKSNNRHSQIKIEGNLGSCLMSLGRLRQAHVRLSKAIELSRKYHDPAGEAMWLVSLGRSALENGRLNDADRHAMAALKLAKSRELTLTVFRAEWLRHLVVRRRRPGDADRRRVAYLEKLYRRLPGHEGLTEIQEFKEAVILGDGSPAGGSDA